MTKTPPVPDPVDPWHAPLTRSALTIADRPTHQRRIWHLARPDTDSFALIEEETNFYPFPLSLHRARSSSSVLSLSPQYTVSGQVTIGRNRADSASPALAAPFTSFLRALLIAVTDRSGCLTSLCLGFLLPEGSDRDDVVVPVLTD
ncbi:hypothetical protein N7510_003877 [Penicillium lagena]|uniref:uncharacterized protein n=1 Tax=Penicillium lagena TaxID=94218 RepID=UPI00254244BD|nr:uncharacterized protein N7510_003877 [Penicillium lagena]KAJ5619893.1 hypothetical protein N7510_003877 [Penicillium lagena]